MAAFGQTIVALVSFLLWIADALRDFAVVVEGGDDVVVSPLGAPFVFASAGPGPETWRVHPARFTDGGLRAFAALTLIHEHDASPVPRPADDLVHVLCAEDRAPLTPLASRGAVTTASEPLRDSNNCRRSL